MLNIHKFYWIDAWIRTKFCSLFYDFDSEKGKNSCVPYFYCCQDTVKLGYNKHMVIADMVNICFFASRLMFLGTAEYRTYVGGP